MLSGPNRPNPEISAPDISASALDTSHDARNRAAGGESPSFSRRHVLGLGAAACAMATMASRVRAATPAMQATPPSVLSHPPRLWGDAAPVIYTPDPDIITLDPSFNDLLYGNAGLEQAWRATPRQPVKWLEGPAWCNEGRFLLLSDVVGSTQYRYLDETREMTVFRKESYHSNGNTFDREGRLLTCEHNLRRVIRWEHDGSCTVIAESYRGKRLNSPNDIIVGSDGGIWFTDPPYGDRLWEGHPDAPNAHKGAPERIRWNLDAEIAAEIGGRVKQAAHVFHVDPTTLEITAVLTENELAGPNGLCFSPDGQTLYVVSSDKGAAHPGGGGYCNIYAFDVEGKTLKNQRVFADMMLDRRKLMPDGIKADLDGNVWVGASGPLGLGGVLVYSPASRMIGRLRLPRSVSNLTFGGTQRNRLYMCAKDAIFSLDVAIQGAGYS